MDRWNAIRLVISAHYTQTQTDFWILYKGNLTVAHDFLNILPAWKSLHLASVLFLLSLISQGL